MRRDFTYIDDIVAGVLAALDRPPAGHVVYNLGNHRAEELLRVVALIEAATGREAIRDLLPMQAGDVPATYADIAATTAALGWVPTTGIDKGVPRFVDWFRAYTKL